MPLYSNAYSCIIFCQQQLVRPHINLLNYQLPKFNCRRLSPIVLALWFFCLIYKKIFFIQSEVICTLVSSKLQLGMQKQMRRNHSTSEIFHKVRNLYVVHNNSLLIVTSLVSMGFDYKPSFITCIIANAHQFFKKIHSVERNDNQ